MGKPQKAHPIRVLERKATQTEHDETRNAAIPHKPAIMQRFLVAFGVLAGNMKELLGLAQTCRTAEAEIFQFQKPGDQPLSGPPFRTVCCRGHVGPADGANFCEVHAGIALLLLTSQWARKSETSWTTHMGMNFT